MKVFESKEDQYQNILDASIERVIHGGESLKAVLLDHPAWAERLQMDIQLVCELTSMQQSLDPRPGFLDLTRHELLQEIKNASLQTTSPPAEWWSSILPSRIKKQNSPVIARQHHRRSNLFNLKPLSSLAEWCSSILPSRMALSHSTTLRPSARNDRLSTLLHFLKSPKFPNRYLQTAQKCLLIAVILLLTLFSLHALNLGTSGSLPGSALFPVRVASESIQSLTKIDEAEKASTHLEFAQAYLVDYATLASKGRWVEAQEALRQYDRHIVRTSRLLHDLSQTADQEFGELNSLFTRTYLSDLELFQVLSSSSTKSKVSS